MFNMKARVTPEQILIVEIDLTSTPRPSKRHGSNNLVIATTDGTLPLVGPDGVIRSEKLNLSLWKRRPDSELDGDPYAGLSNRIAEITGSLP